MVVGNRCGMTGGEGGQAASRALFGLPGYLVNMVLLPMVDSISNHLI